MLFERVAIWTASNRMNFTRDRDLLEFLTQETQFTYNGLKIPSLIIVFVKKILE